jgi:Na+/H+ antiporter NhaA
MSRLPDMRERINGAAACFQHEASGGAVLVLLALAAMAVDTSPAPKIYDGFLDTRLGVRLGELAAR